MICQRSLVFLSCLCFPFVGAAACWAQLASSPWPSYGDDAGNTHCSSLVGPDPSAHVLWKYVCPGSVFRQPVIASDGTILFITHGSDDLMALSASGSLRWQKASGHRMSEWPAVDALGRVYYATWPDYYSGARVLHAVQVSNGQEVWAAGMPDNYAYIQSGVTVGANNTVYVGHQNGALYSYSSDGHLQWSSQGGGYEVTPAIAPNGNIVTGGGYGVQANSQSGQLLWTHDMPGNVGSVAVAANGTIYAGSFSDTVGGRQSLTALSDTGQTLWTLDHAGGSPSIGPDGTIYSGTSTLYALRPDGTEKWHYYVGQTADESVCCEGVAVDANGNLYLTNSQGLLMSLSALGQLRWSLDLAPNTANNIYPSMPIIGSNGTLYVGTGYNNELVAITPEPGTMALVALGGLALLGRKRQ